MRHNVWLRVRGGLRGSYRSHTPLVGECVCARDLRNEQMWSRWWPATHPRVSFLSELMAAVWIDGFVNGREATGGVYLVSIYNRSNVPANQIDVQGGGAQIKQY